MSVSPWLIAAAPCTWQTNLWASALQGVVIIVIFFKSTIKSSGNLSLLLDVTHGHAVFLFIIYLHGPGSARSQAVPCVKTCRP